MSVRNLILILLACTAVVLKYGFDYRAQVAGLAIQTGNARSEANERTRLADLFQVRIGSAPKTAAQPIQQGAPAAVMTMLRSRVDKLVTITAITNTNFQSATGTRAIAETTLKSQVGLQVMRLTIKGTYRDLKAFTEYFEELKRHGVALDNMKIERENFDAVIEIYGV